MAGTNSGKSEGVVWKNLPQGISKSHQTFLLKAPPPSSDPCKKFLRGYPYANSLHTQLRLGRSYLSAHGYSIGLNNSDLCICSRPETTKHFFTCFLYQEEQKLLHEKVSQQIANFSMLSLNRQVDIFLNGINTELDPRNLPIVFAGQTYILQTQQFT